MKALLTSGEIIELPKECDCVTHDDPHWLHMDKITRDQNASFLDRIKLSNDPMWEAALNNLSASEDARLKEKMFNMNRLKIERLIYE
jgi:hypothetical protein